MQSMSLEPWVPCLVLVLSWPSSVYLEVLILVDPGEEECSRRHYLSVTALARPHKGKYPCCLKQSHGQTWPVLLSSSHSWGGVKWLELGHRMPSSKIRGHRAALTSSFQGLEHAGGVQRGGQANRQ